MKTTTYLLFALLSFSSILLGFKRHHPQETVGHSDKKPKLAIDQILADKALLNFEDLPEDMHQEIMQNLISSMLLESKTYTDFVIIINLLTISKNLKSVFEKNIKALEINFNKSDLSEKDLSEKDLRLKYNLAILKAIAKSIKEEEKANFKDVCSKEEFDKLIAGFDFPNWEELSATSELTKENFEKMILDHPSVNSVKITPLMLACGYGYLEIAKILIQLGANIDIWIENKPGTVNHYNYESIFDNYHISALTLAIQNSRNRIVKLLNLKIPLLYQFQFNGLWLAYENNNFDLIKLLAEEDDSPDHYVNLDLFEELAVLKDSVEDGISILSLYILDNNLEMVKLLAPYSNQIMNNSDWDGPIYYAIVHATYTKNFQILNYLLSLDADTSKILCFAIAFKKNLNSYEDNHEVVKLLIEQGVNVNEIDLQGQSALELAIKYNHSKTVKLLLDNGAIINDDLKYLNLARNSENQEIINLIEDNIKNKNL